MRNAGLCGGQKCGSGHYVLSQSIAVAGTGMRVLFGLAGRTDQWMGRGRAGQHGLGSHTGMGSGMAGQGNVRWAAHWGGQWDGRAGQCGLGSTLGWAVGWRGRAVWAGQHTWGGQRGGCCGAVPDCRPWLATFVSAAGRTSQQGTAASACTLRCCMRHTFVMHFATATFIAALHSCKAQRCSNTAATPRLSHPLVLVRPMPLCCNVRMATMAAWWCLA